MNTEDRKISAQQSIVWTGDLSDDCTAKWAGLMLRAEWMDEDYWWWAVYDMQKGEVTIEDSNEYTERYIDGNAAREKAESVAVKYISDITRAVTATYLIADTFKISGRGLVFAGYITEGIVSIGDMIEFTAFNYLRHRKISGVEGIRKSQPDKVNTGLFIKCEDEVEIDELRDWKPDNEVAIVYKSEIADKN